MRRRRLVLLCLDLASLFEQFSHTLNLVLYRQLIVRVRRRVRCGRRRTRRPRTFSDICSSRRILGCGLLGCCSLLGCKGGLSISLEGWPAGAGPSGHHPYSFWPSTAVCLSTAMSTRVQRSACTSASFRSIGSAGNEAGAGGIVPALRG